MRKALEGEVEQVCDYSKGIWDKGHAQGREEGTEKILRLIDLMVENGEADKISGLSKSPEFLDEMLVKYQLT